MSFDKLWIGTSWKMNKPRADARGFAHVLAESELARSDAVRPFVIPPFTAVAEVADLLAATGAAVGVLVYVGDKLDEYKAARAAQVLARQAQAAVSGISREDAWRAVIAYEPAWSIGEGGYPPSPRLPANSTRSSRRRYAIRLGTSCALFTGQRQSGQLRRSSRAAEHRRPVHRSIRLAAGRLSRDRPQRSYLAV